MRWGSTGGHKRLSKTPSSAERRPCAGGTTPNQIECHPLLPQHELREYCATEGVEVVGYSPLARGSVFEVDELSEIAAKHGASEAQMSLAWLREQGVTVIPKATSCDHVVDNWESLGVSLDDDDRERIAAIDRTDRKVHPSFAPDAWK